MHKIEWSDRLSLGIAALDSQHRFLVSLINGVLVALDGDPSERDRIVAAAFRELKEYARQHFRDEEEFMRHAGFPYLEDHHREHERLTCQVEEYSRRIDVANLGSAEVRDFLSAWILDHIMGWDFNIAEFLKYGPDAGGPPGNRA